MGCGSCKGAAAVAKAASNVTHGAAQAARSLVGVGLAPRDVIERRRAVCRSCEHATPCARDPSRRCWCGKLRDSLRPDTPTCGCNLRLKTRLADERCPLGRW